MIRYEFVPSHDGLQGELHVYEDDVLIAKKQGVASFRECGGEHWIERMTTHSNARNPGKMIPLDDPRLYTHCQWCGQGIERGTNGQGAAWCDGSWHTACYDHLFAPCFSCGRRTRMAAGDRCWFCGREQKEKENAIL